MKLDKILVYDNQHYLGRLLKNEFKETFEFKVFKNFNKVENFDNIEKNYSIIVFAIYSESDLFDFIRIYGKGVHIIVAIHDNGILKKMKKVSDIFLLDTFSTRGEILDKISKLFSICTY